MAVAMGSTLVSMTMECCTKKTSEDAQNVPHDNKITIVVSVQ